MSKGMYASSRGVGYSLVMVAMLVYVFAIVLHMFLKEEETEVKDAFDTLPDCMWTLLMDGTFMDNTGSLMKDLFHIGQWPMVLVFMIFVLLSAMTVMNMLIGVLCEVVSEVEESEKEDAAIRLLKET